MGIVSIICYIICVYVIYRLINLLNLRSRIPKGLKTLPGPWGLPLIGYLPFLTIKPFKKYMALRRDYGNIFQLQIGIRNVVVISSGDLIKKAYSDTVFNGRPNTPSMQTIARGTGTIRLGFISAQGQWRLLRKCAVRALNLFANSRNSTLKDNVQGASSILIRDLEKSKGMPLDPETYIRDCVAGVIGSVAFGTNFEADDAIISNLIDQTEKFAKFFQIGSIIDSMPFGEFIMRKQATDMVEQFKHITELNHKHIKDREPSEKIRDIADALWKTATETPTVETDALELKNWNIRSISEDLFGAGFATTMESGIWMINILAKYQDIQDIARNEIVDVLGDSEPSIDRKFELPYIEAFLYEMLRFVSLTPLGLPHAAMEDTELDGYFIPSDSIIFANFYGHHHDPTQFNDPEKFSPERFLTTDRQGNKVFKTDEGSKVISFSTGKRRCPGEIFAKQELFLLLITLIQHFKISPGPKVCINLDDCLPGLTRRPMRYKLVFDRIM